MLSRVIPFLTENWGLKLAAVALAVLLWLAVTANELQRGTFRNVDVVVDVRDPDWRLARPPEPEEISMTVQGPRGELVAIGGEPIRIPLRVERVTDEVESQVIPIQWVQQQLPAGVRDSRVIGIRPDTIRLYYERLDSRTLPVRVTTTGALAAGVTLTQPILTNPAAVEVRGPARDLQRLDSIPLLPVDLAGLRSTTNVPTQVDTTGLDGFSFEPLEVNVVLRVTPGDSLPPDTARNPAPF